MSLVRVGMSDNKKVSEGWDAVFGKKKTAATVKKPVAKKPKVKKK